MSSWIPPQRWIERNPRDPTHVSAALRKLASLSGQEFYTTERSMEDLRRLGIQPNIPGMRVATPKHIGAVIGGFFFLDKGLLYPDNILVSCAHCHAALQIRPHANYKARKLCCFCAVDEALMEQ